MKKILFALVVTTFAFIGNAQVGIGTDMPNESSQLEVVASDKGILIPQVALTGLTDQTSISNGNVESLLVYNTTLAGNLTPGYYYWSDNKWNRILVGDMQPINPVTDFVDNGDGTYTYTNEEGTEYVLDIPAYETVTTLVDNNDGTITYTDEDGVETIISLASIIESYETLTSIAVDASAGTLTFIDEDGISNIFDIAALVSMQETITTLVENTDGTFTYTNEDGIATILDVANMETLTGIALNPDDIHIDYTDEDGNVTQLDLSAIVANLETVTTLVENTDGTFTYTNEDGTATILDVANMETLTSVALNSDDIHIDYTDEDGNVTQLDLTAIVENLETNTTLAFNNTTSELTYTNEDADNPVLDLSSLKVEPWNVESTTNKATSNTQNIYQMGNIAIGKNASYTGTVLDVEGAVRGGTNPQGSVGANSVAFGEGNTASGVNSIAFGEGNAASGVVSTVSGGLNNSATGMYSGISAGRDNTTTGYAAVVFGGGSNTASANYSSVFGGRFNSASAGLSIVSGGIYNTTLGMGSFATGQNNTAASSYEWVGGSFSTTYVPLDTNNWNLADRLFNIGAGLNDLSRHDAFTILKNGKTGVGFDNFETTTFDQKLQVNGNARIAGLPAVLGDTSTDKMVVVDADGVLKSVDASAIQATEPWYVESTTDEATSNTENIYQMGNVAIGKDVTYSSGGFLESDVVLDVAGAIRAGSNPQGFVGENSVAFGDGNRAEGRNSMVSGGFNNSAGFDNSVISGGENNTASALNSAVLGGINNTASGEGAIVSGGLLNTASGSLSVVSGGQFNVASEAYSIVAGGFNNKALGGDSGVFGGENNTASGGSSVVIGGRGNTAFSDSEIVGGLYSTTYSPQETTGSVHPADRLFNIGAGLGETSRHDAFTILKNGKTGVGFDNFETITFDQKLQVNGNARIAGLPGVLGDTSTDKIVLVDTDGVLKSVDASAMVSAEPWNIQGTTDDATLNTENIYQMGSIAIGKDAVYTGAALDIEGAVRGGTNQQGTVGANSVAFGDGNIASGTNSVAIGKENTAKLESSVVMGHRNTAEREFSVVMGWNNTAEGEYSVIMGRNNRTTFSRSVVAGGEENTASHISVVSGGSYNSASGYTSVVTGGQQNTAAGAYSIVSGGFANTAASAHEWVGGSFGTEYTPQDDMFWNSADRLFNIGGGNDFTNRHDAFTILKNGKTGVGFDNFENTTFDQKLQVNGNARFAGLPGVVGDTSTDKVVVVDADGVLKSVKAAMPKFFYMPSVVFDTSAGGTGLTKNLYQEYTNQFQTTMVSSTGANTSIPTLAAAELEYHITYYDTNVFANLSIDANGVLTYDVIGTPTAASFMNIVFVVK